jgi:hypothetical protein
LPVPETPEPGPTYDSATPVPASSATE